jgi:hypothetical protein
MDNGVTVDTGATTTMGPDGESRSRRGCLEKYSQIGRIVRTRRSSSRDGQVEQLDLQTGRPSPYPLRYRHFLFRDESPYIQLEYLVQFLQLESYARLSEAVSPR